MTNEFKDKVILVTGGTGTIGSALVEELLKHQPKQIRILSRDESKQYEFLEKFDHPTNIRMLIGDIRDRERLDMAFKDVDLVFHAAALKHVPFCEYNPFETVKTNVLGSQNVIDAALKNNVTKVIGISTDKVVNPAGIMGTSKLLMEKLFINANYYKGDAKTMFACVRFGNVAWARGSVFPIWREQVEREKLIKVTNPNMTRFLMSVSEAANLILEAAHFTQGGEIFILKMPAVRLGDLAKLFLRKYYPKEKIKLVMVGNRGAEKMHEELVGENHLNGKIFESNKIIIIVPEVKIYSLAKQKFGRYRGFKEQKRTKAYVSKNHLNLKKIKEII